ncbi:ABC transporter ATP-binding protein [Cohnella terricola]|uniref:ABC transporter ATP-binding protein n=1 Tax=Cohnella terricola TaxID=1289167 RepID=A0A559JJE8_9BACL|nr:ABC transporter ATP-binding protein [Cohnella terricola]TVY00004.1 ABC transporter ATP-binding protein [Cohnella terricola]
MKSTHLFQAQQLVAGYDHKAIIHGIDLAIPSHKISVIMGSNGCGKSTLLKTLARLIKPMSGTITIDNEAIGDLSPRKFAKVVGLLPQSPIVPEGITVADLVGRGRFPHQSWFGGWTKRDYEAVAEAMDMMNITEYANQHMDELSGGQRQRVWIAMALAQQTDILFLDEPTTFLDITYQIEILDLLTDLNRKYGTTIVMVLHDINLSARYADHVFALREGKLVAGGTPTEVITSERIKDIFGLSCSVITDPLSGSPLVVPQGRHHVQEASSSDSNRFLTK